MLRNGKQMINEGAHVHERWASWLLFEHFPCREVGIGSNDKELIQHLAGRLGEVLEDLAIQSACRDGSNMVSGFIKGRKGRQLKVVFGQSLQRDIDQICCILFGPGYRDHALGGARAIASPVRLYLPASSAKRKSSLPLSTP